MPQDKTEGIYVIHMRKVYRARHRRNRGQRAIKYIRTFLERHLGGKVILDPAISIYIYKKKIEKPPRVVAVRFMKIDQGVYKACLALLAKR
ncbi:MAG: 60S ribosomal protein L31 [Desulfurococcaceae archaeon]|jgi:ribosomal protein L31E|nr:60S ribosomal protein L31 [Desulfurococcaceae archaeon]